MEEGNTQSINQFLSHFDTSLINQDFVKLTLSKPSRHAGDLQNVYIRPILIRQQTKLSFTYRHLSNDQVKNYDPEEAREELARLLKDTFRISTLFTLAADIVLMFSKKDKAALRQNKPSLAGISSAEHDREKTRRAGKNEAYLTSLGIADGEGKVVPKMADKYRQINKYLEIIESLIREARLPEEINIVDMGSGKGYLTFALYDYLHNKLQRKVHVTGIELREELVDYCNKIAAECEFAGLKFECKPIEAYQGKHIDILIALHACDTATDDAILKGIVSDASLIICAPCCHKQIRQQIKGKEQTSPIMKYGIFKERQCEMVTDTIRALIMEKKQYETKIFEFISNEHTRKNVMLAGIKSDQKPDEKSINEKIDALKNEYGIDYHYLERALSM